MIKHFSSDELACIIQDGHLTVCGPGEAIVWWENKQYRIALSPSAVKQVTLYFATDQFKELSLFSGSGGGLLASHLMGWATLGYVEYDKYCQQVIAQRIEDGFIDRAPIFGDIRTFISEGYAQSYQGMVDIVTGGFPCQPFSQAGKQLAADDPRNMWPETAEVIRIVRPKFAFLENVPGLLVGASRYFSTVLGDLAEMGYNARWGVLGAHHTGAHHKRDRLWIFAHTNDEDQARCVRRCKSTQIVVDYNFRHPEHK